MRKKNLICIVMQFKIPNFKENITKHIQKKKGHILCSVVWKKNSKTGLIFSREQFKIEPGGNQEAELHLPALVSTERWLPNSCKSVYQHQSHFLESNLFNTFESHPLFYLYKLCPFLSPSEHILGFPPQICVSKLQFLQDHQIKLLYSL